MSYLVLAWFRILPRSLVVLATAACLVPACDTYFPDDPLIVRDEVVGLRPNYISVEEARTLDLVAGVDLGDRSGLPVELADFTLSAVPDRGLIIQTKAQPLPGSGSSLRVPGFVRITGAEGNVVTFESYADVVTVRIDAIDRFTLISRASDRLVVDPYALLRRSTDRLEFSDLESAYTGAFFLECVDSTSGYVQSWSQVSLRRPQCLFQ